MNIINENINEKMNKFWAAYNDLVGDKEFRKELKKCGELIEGEMKEGEEEEYIIKMLNFCEDVIDRVKVDTGYWGEDYKRPDDLGMYTGVKVSE